MHHVRPVAKLAQGRHMTRLNDKDWRLECEADYELWFHTEILQLTKTFEECLLYIKKHARLVGQGLSFTITAFLG